MYANTEEENRRQSEPGGRSGGLPVVIYHTPCVCVCVCMYQRAPTCVVCVCVCNDISSRNTTTTTTTHGGYVARVRIRRMGYTVFDINLPQREFPRFIHVCVYINI